MAPSVDDHHGVQQCKGFPCPCWKRGGAVGVTAPLHPLGEHHYVGGVAREASGGQAGCLGIFDDQNMFSWSLPPFFPKEKRRDAKARKMGSQRSMGLGRTGVHPRNPQAKQGHALLLDGCMLAPSKLKPERKRMCRGFRRFNAHAEQEGFALGRMGYSASKALDDSHYSKWTIVYVRDFDLFVTVQLLDDASPVQSLGQLCEDHGYSSESFSGVRCAAL